MAPDEHSQQQPAFQDRLPQVDGMAIASLVLGCASIFGLALTGIPAIICGHIARRRIQKSQGGLTGSGLAFAGLVLGYAATACMLVILSVVAES
jgi:hypothetical protein